jgi:demethylmenaquinone methyltransferase/2-methoxy-6-polyprenyl-1,4-benzoquinol methylase
LELSAGETVLDVGCGPGSNFEMLHDAVTPGGEVVGCDYSPEMIKQARRRARTNGWDSVRVEQVDVRQSLPDVPFEAAVATQALSAMGDPEAVITNVHDRLRPGGRFFVMDGMLSDEGFRSVLNPVVSGLFTRLANWDETAAAAI